MDYALVNRGDLNVSIHTAAVSICNATLSLVHTWPQRQFAGPVVVDITTKDRHDAVCLRRSMVQVELFVRVALITSSTRTTTITTTTTTTITPPPATAPKRYDRRRISSEEPVGIQIFLGLGIFTFIILSALCCCF